MDLKDVNMPNDSRLSPLAKEIVKITSCVITKRVIVDMCDDPAFKPEIGFFKMCRGMGIYIHKRHREFP